MKYFFCKLIPPRLDFVQTITPAEAQLMQEHGAYWKSMMDRGLVAAFGVDRHRILLRGRIVHFARREGAAA